MAVIKNDIAEVTGIGQIVVGCKGGCKSLQWALQVAIEADPSFAHAFVDAINGFNEMERHATRLNIVAATRLHNIFPPFEMLYNDKVGKLWYFDEEGNLTNSLESRRGVRHGCVLCLFIFCVTMVPIYVALKAELGREGMLVAFSDDVFLHGPPPSVSSAISAAP
jgi:hypothetical protein